MSGYIVEEPNEDPIRYNNDNTISEEYYLNYSPIQKKRFMKVMRQMRETWFDVYKQIKIMRDYGISIDDSNNIMSKVHRLFIIEHKNKIDFYNEEKIRLRKNNNYITKKINKLKNLKNKL